MKRIYIICEGQTEQEFCNKTLRQHFNQIHYLFAPVIKESRGGIVHWQKLRKQIETQLKCDKEAYVTTFIDYYGIKKSHEFPNWDAHNIQDKYKKLELIEQGMKDNLSIDLQDRFIPYLQLHEFESLLFSNCDIFEANIPSKDLINPRHLYSTVQKYPNPELINDNPDSSPSKRLMKIIKGYNKVLHGNMLAESIGLATIRSNCQKFDKWITTLQTL